MHTLVHHSELDILLPSPSRDPRQSYSITVLPHLVELLNPHETMSSFFVAYDNWEDK